MANHTTIVYEKKDGTVEKIGGWKVNFIIWAFSVSLVTGVVVISENVWKTGKLVAASLKK